MHRLPSVAVRQHANRPLPPRRGVLHDPLRSMPPNVLIVAHIIKQHLLGSTNIGFFDRLSICTRFGRSLLRDPLQLARCIRQIHRSGAARDEVVQLVGNEGADVFGHGRALHSGKLDGQRQRRHNGNGGCASRPHLLDGVPCVGGRVDVVIFLAVGQFQLVEDLEPAARVFDGLEHHSEVVVSAVPCPCCVLLWRRGGGAEAAMPQAG